MIKYDYLMRNGQSDGKKTANKFKIWFKYKRRGTLDMEDQRRRGRRKENKGKEEEGSEEDTGWKE